MILLHGIPWNIIGIVAAILLFMQIIPYIILFMFMFNMVKMLGEIVKS